MDEDGYAGPAELLIDGAAVAITLKLAGHFDPITGSYSWYGRVAATPEVAALMVQGTRKVVLRTPHADVETTLSDVDPWGRPRVQGFGAAPFAVLADVPD
jgi:Domain of unknown function (DUF4873)